MDTFAHSSMMSMMGSDKDDGEGGIMGHHAPFRHDEDGRQVLLR